MGQQLSVALGGISDEELKELKATRGASPGASQPVTVQSEEELNLKNEWNKFDARNRARNRKTSSPIPGAVVTFKGEFVSL
jgi:hypothetical protein